MSCELAAYEASRCLQCDFFVDINKDTCHRCGRCVESCPQEALELAYQEAILASPELGLVMANGLLMRLQRFSRTRNFAPSVAHA